MFIVSEEYFFYNVIKYSEAEISNIIQYKERYYNEFEIPKENGKRKINGINVESDLSIIQRRLLDNFLSKIELPLCAKGFIKNASYIDYLIEHKNKNYYLRMDIQHFFDSITKEQIEENLKEYINIPRLLNYCIELCTLNGKLPQGAITSPAISNIIFRRIDQRITKYCQKFDIEYTRYADDLLFSSNKLDFSKEKWFYKKIKYILKDNGFLSNYNKKRTAKNKISFSGYVVQNDVHLSRKKLKDINKILYYFKDTSNTSKYVVNQKILKDDYLAEIRKFGIKGKNNQNKKFKSNSELINYLCGYRSFIISIIKANSKKNRGLANKVKQIEKVVKQLEPYN